MRGMIKVVAVVFLVATGAFQAAMSMTITTVGNGGDHYGMGPYQKDSGGEFTVLPSSDLGVNLAAYSAATRDVYQAGTFQTFCLEIPEHIDGWTTYNVTLDSGAVRGGYAGGNPDPISLGTAWLYDQFVAGTLSGYDYSGARSSAVVLQNTFWFLENELKTLTDYTFYNLAFGAIGGNIMADNNGTYKVSVLNLTDPSDGSPRQSLLVKVPDSGLTIALLGIAMGCVGMVSRRLFK